MIKEFVMVGFFCSKCYSIIDGHFSRDGVFRTCDNCSKASKNVIDIPRKKVFEKS